MARRQRLVATEVVAALPRLRRYARVLMGDADAADRLVADTLASAWQRQAALPAEIDLGTWLFGLMHAAHRNAPDQTRSGPHAGDGNGAGAADLCTRVLQLPVEEREVLLLAVVEHLSYEHIARLLDVPVDTVTATLARARERMGATTASVPTAPQPGPPN